MTEVALQPVRVLLEGEQEGRLVFVGNALAAVLVRLSELHGEQAGGWFLEAGFGPLDGADHPVFPDLDVAQAWVVTRLTREGRTFIA